VAKAWLDVGVRPSGAHWRVANAEAEVPALVARLRTLDPQLVVLEATGGYERAAVASLAAAGRPVVVINPRQVRDAGQGDGTLGEDRYARRPGAGALRRSGPPRAASPE
jgi:transposase